ncbi:MAG: GNAT family N-acetyltransferase [Thermomicrobiales bacterium]
MIHPAVAAPVVSDAQHLSLEDFDRASVFWQDRIDLRQARNVLLRFPERSVWSPENRECLIVGDWRNRPEIASIVGSTAIRGRKALYIEAARLAHESGLEAILAIEWTERQSPDFYHSAGYQRLDAVLPFELEARRRPPPVFGSLPIVSLDSRHTATKEALLDVDHAAFDWLWINSRAEFEQYGSYDGVELWGHAEGDRLVSYAGLTRLGDWGHIDRLAVHPAWQQRGLGEALTRFSIDRLLRAGARTVGLSTQASNMRSQRLYAKLGFRRTSTNAYQVYGQRFGNH